MKSQELEADVLIIGGGAAGCAAALKTRELGARPLMVVKGKMGRSGATPLAAFLVPPPNIPGPHSTLAFLKKAYSSLSEKVRLPFPPGYAEDFRKMMAEHYWLVDQDYFMDAALWAAKEFFPYIEKTGLYLRRDDEGRPMSPPKRVYHTVYKAGMSGYQYGEFKRKEVLAAGVNVLEETTVFSLLTDPSGRVNGAMAVDYNRGKLYAIKAKTVILATGHTNWISKRATGTREMAANGLALAARLGTELQNLEIQWFHASDNAHPESWMRMQHYPNALEGTRHQAVMINADGEEYLRVEDFEISIPYTIQMKELYKQVQKGEARWDGQNYTSYRLVGREPLEKYQYHWEFYQKLGLDPAKEPLESAVTWHMSAGGIRANLKNMSTNIPGLYIAGPVGAHMLGGIPLAAFDGTVAATDAVHSSMRPPSPRLDEKQVKAAEEKTCNYFSQAGSGGIPPIQIKNRIRETVWDNLMFVRTEKGLNEAIDQLKAIQDEMVPSMRLRTGSSRYNTDLMDALDVPDMLDVAEMVAHAALVRTESRGPHFREDYPFTDNKNWLKYVVVRREGDRVKSRLEPVKLKYMEPKREILDYLKEPFA